MGIETLPVPTVRFYTLLQESSYSLAEGNCRSIGDRYMDYGVGGNRLFRKISIQSVQYWIVLTNVLSDYAAVLRVESVLASTA